MRISVAARMSLMPEPAHGQGASKHTAVPATDAQHRAHKGGLPQGSSETRTLIGRMWKASNRLS